MRHFLDFVLRHLVDFPDDVDVREVDEDGSITFLVMLHPHDVGKVIGRNGRTIGAIRNLISTASRADQRVTVRICEP